MNKKTVALLMACVLLVGAAIGGTMAWLVDDTDPVTNVFTVGDINITLEETDAESIQTGGYKKDYLFVPGDKLAKDPKVTVLADSENCYLFVNVTDVNNNITDENNGNKVINWSVNTTEGQWKEVPNHGGYWYREVTKDTGKSQEFYVFTDPKTDDNFTGSITVSTVVDKSYVDTMGKNATKPARPEIIVRAAAVQSDNVENVEAAWQIAFGN